MSTSYVLISSLSSLKESRASAASTEIDIIPSTSCNKGTELLRHKTDEILKRRPYLLSLKEPRTAQAHQNQFAAVQLCDCTYAKTNVCVYTET